MVIRLSIVLALLLVNGTAVAQSKKYRCEKKEDGKWTVVKDVKSRKACKGKGGKWVKDDHDHDHGGDHDHEHEED